MGEVVRLHMSENLASAIATRDAVIRGDLAEAREELEWMANNADPGTSIAAGAPKSASRTSPLSPASTFWG